MSEMLNRVAKAIQDAQEKPRYVVKISKMWECWDVQENKLILSSEIHAYVNEECDKGNDLYAARKAVEALKTVTDDMQVEYYSIAMGEGYSAMNACFPHAAWERAIDAILSGDK